MLSSEDQGLDEVILQVFEEHEETFHFPVASQKEARAFVKALHGKGLSYDSLLREIKELEQNFSAWRKGISRPGIGNRMIERINRPLQEILLPDGEEEDPDYLDQLSTDSDEVESNHNGIETKKNGENRLAADSKSNVLQTGNATDNQKHGKGDTCSGSASVTFAEKNDSKSLGNSSVEVYDKAVDVTKDLSGKTEAGKDKVTDGEIQKDVPQGQTKQGSSVAENKTVVGASGKSVKIIEKKQEAVTEKKQEAVAEKNQEAVTEKKQAVTEKKQEAVTEKKQAVTEKKQEAVTEKKQEAGAEKKQEAVAEKKQEAVAEKKQEAVAEKNQEAVAEKKQEAVAEKKQEAVAEKKQEAVAEKKQEAVAEKKQEAAAEKKQEAVAEKKQEVTEEKQVPAAKKQEAVTDTKQDAVTEKKQAVTDNKLVAVTEKKQEAVTDKKEGVVTEKKQETATEKKQETVTDKKEGVVTEKKQEAVTEKKQAITEVVADKKQEVLTEKKQAVTEKKQEAVTEKKQAVTEIKQEAVTEKKQEAITEKKQEAVAEKKQEVVTEKKQEAITEKKPEAVAEKKQEAVIEKKQEVVSEKKQEAVTEKKQEAFTEEKQMAALTNDQKTAQPVNVKTKEVDLKSGIVPVKEEVQDQRVNKEKSVESFEKCESECPKKEIAGIAAQCKSEPPGELVKHDAATLKEAHGTSNTSEKKPESVVSGEVLSQSGNSQIQSKVVEHRSINVHADPLNQVQLPQKENTSASMFSLSSAADAASQKIKLDQLQSHPSTSDGRCQGKSNDVLESYDSDFDDEHNHDAKCGVTSTSDESSMTCCKPRVTNESQVGDSAGYVYVFTDSSAEKVACRVKVGASRFPHKKLQQSLLFNIDMKLVSAVQVSDRRKALDAVHQKLNAFSIPKTVGWFCGPLDRILSVLMAVAKDYPHQD